MSSPPLTAADAAIDPATIAEIVRRVLARLRTSDHHVSTIKLVTAETVIAAAANKRTILVSTKSVVTPAARDEAKRLGVLLEAMVQPTGTADRVSSNATLGMIDTTAASAVESVIAGLARRGIPAVAGYAATMVVMTDEPAKQTYHYSSSGTRRAAMLSELSQVSRFQRELAPDVWVIDKTQMGLPTIVNTVAMIARFSGAHS